MEKCMTLQQLQQVITIAESKSMNEAAKKLFVSQPNLSSVVREVEEETGITLFIRSNRGIVMTPEGEEFIGYLLINQTTKYTILIISYQ